MLDPRDGNILNLQRMGDFPQRFPIHSCSLQPRIWGDNGLFSASKELAKVSFYLRVKKWGATALPNLGL